MIPKAYLYLVDIDTEVPIAIFSADECRRGLELISLEARIRAEHNVDDTASGLALRDSAHAPLSVDVVRRVMRQMRNST